MQLGHMTIDQTFSESLIAMSKVEMLSAMSKVEMLSAMTNIQGSIVYVVSVQVTGDR